MPDMPDEDKKDDDENSLADLRPKPPEPILILNGKRLRFVRGIDAIEASTDGAVVRVYGEALAHIAHIARSLGEGSLDDADGLLREGLQRIADGKADFHLSPEGAHRFSFMVFNARATISLSARIEPDTAADFEALQAIVRQVGSHDDAFWMRMARAIF